MGSDTSGWWGNVYPRMLARTSYQKECANIPCLLTLAASYSKAMSPGSFEPAISANCQAN